MERQTWPSLDSFVDYVAKIKPTHPRSKWVSHLTDRPSFYGGCGSFEGALDLARNGWPEGWNQVSPLIDGYLTRMTSRVERTVWQYDVTGSVLDVAAFVNGEPEHWMVAEPTVAEGLGNKLIRVVSSVGALAHVSAEDFIGRGAAMAALVTLLEHAGHSVSVEVVSPVTIREGVDGDTDYEARVTIKPFGEPIDGPRLIFALAHPSMLRRLVFACRCVSSIGSHILARESYGWSTDTDDQGDIYLPRLIGNEEFNDKWVTDALLRCGVHITNEKG